MVGTDTGKQRMMGGGSVLLGESMTDFEVMQAGRDGLVVYG